MNVMIMMMVMAMMTTMKMMMIFSGSSIILIVLVKDQDNGRLLEDSNIYAEFEGLRKKKEWKSEVEEKNRKLKTA